MISIGKPFDMSALLKHKASIFLSVAVVILLWLSWGFWAGLFEFISELWAWRPETVIGLAMIILPILAAYPTHYFLNVRRTTEAGVIRVSGFADFMGYGLLSLIVGVAYNGSILVGIFILFFGFDIR